MTSGSMPHTVACDSVPAVGHEGRKCGCTDPVRGKIIICLEDSASRERFAEF